MPTPELLPCGCYADACYCGHYPTREEIAQMEIAVMETIAELSAHPDDRYPTLSERLAESAKDDRRASR